MLMLMLWACASSADAVVAFCSGYLGGRGYLECYVTARASMKLLIFPYMSIIIISAARHRDTHDAMQ